MTAARANPKRVIFAEAEDEVVLRAAIQFRDFGYGTPVLVGRDAAVREKLAELGVGNPDSYQIHNSDSSPLVPAMVDLLYCGCNGAAIWAATCERMVNQDRNVFAALDAGDGQGDAMITGMTRTFAQTMREVRQVLDPARASAVRHPPDDRQELTRSSWPTPRSTNGQAPRNWPTSPRKPPQSRGGWAMNRASRSCPIRPSATRRATGWTISARLWRSSMRKSRL